MGERDGVLTGLRFMPPERLSELADVMLEIQTLQSPNGRQAVYALTRQWHPGFKPERSNVDHEEVSNFILACQGDDASFDYLLEAISTRAAGDPDLSVLLDRVETLLPRAALTKGELRGLLALDPDRVAPGQLLAAGMRQACPDWSDPGRYRLAANVREAVLLLLDASSADAGLRRALCFATWMADLAHVAGPAVESGLRAWVSGVADAHGLTADDCRAPGPASLAGLAEEPTLLVELTAARPGLFAVHLWLKVPGADFRTLTWDAEPCPLDELKDRVDALLDLANAEIISLEGELQVEFLLDVENIHQAVDWWPIESQSILPRPLGAVYKVAIRRRNPTSTELRARDAWWRAIRQATAPAADLAVLVADTEGSVENAKRLWSQLSGRDRILIAPLTETMRPLVELALKMGLPVALCLRGDPADAAGQLLALKQELGDAAMADLPDQVLRWRHDAFMADGDHFGRSLMLLWDDHDRPPPGPGEKLRSPAMKGTR